MLRLSLQELKLFLDSIQPLTTSHITVITLSGEGLIGFVIKVKIRFP